MKRDRFSLLMRFLHLNDSTQYRRKGEPGHDPLFKLRPFLSPLIKNFQSSYTLNREVSLDESMIGFKGRLGFIQYMPKKPTKWGLKAFVVSDAKTGYIYNWHLYTGTEISNSLQLTTVLILCTGKDDSLASGDVGMTHAVVMKLVDPIKDSGHHVYMDNYYTSPQVFSDLRANGFGACGTLRLNRRGLPPAIQEKVRKGERRAIEVDASMLAVKWMDKRVVTVKWWRRAFLYLLDMAVVNSYILYTLKHPDKKRRLTHEQFRVQLATDLLSAAGDIAVSHQGPHRHSSQPVARLTERHFLASLGRNDAGCPIQQDCVVCSKRKGKGRKTTTYQCRECNLPMCVVPCFELYHTKKEPQRYLP